MSDRHRAAIVVTGDEVLGGRVAERNAAYLARELAGHGVAVERTLIVGDRLDTIAAEVGDLVARGYALVCVTGGLGPTYDDLTMAAVAKATERRLRLFPDALDLVRERSRTVRRRMQVSDAQLEDMRVKQATLPDGATVLPPIGTAPGCIVTHDGALVVVLPGPPNEAIPMWEAATTDGPLAALLALGPTVATRTLRVWAVVEAELMTVLGRLSQDELASIGTYTRAGELEVVVPTALADRVATMLEDAFPDSVFARDGELVEDIVARELLRRDERLAVAESCTGGGLGARLTAVPGASRWFDGGVIAYDDHVKEHVLGVPRDVLELHGAVSGECAVAMAQGATTVTGARWGVSITGIAGPDGGSAEKPVGLVWIAVAGERPQAHRHQFWVRDREGIRLRAQTAALHALRLALQG